MLLVLLNNRKKILSFIAVFAMAAVLIIWLLLLLNQKAFYEGVLVENTSLSGLNRDEARRVIEKKLTEAKNNKIVLKCRENIWTIPLESISYRGLLDEALNEAYVIGRTGNIYRRLIEIFTLRFNKKNIPIFYSYDKNVILTILNDIKKQTDIEATDATVSYKNGNIIKNKENVGFSLDIDKNMNLIENQLMKGNFDNIELILDEKKPKVIYENIKEIDQVLASFSTIFNPQDANRTYNIKLACERINEKVLLPKETFSMNRALGPRTIENGYKDAPVIYKNELIPGPGGGVCQVTTTLYNAVLKTRLNVVERTHHSMPLGYVQPGQDATIAEDYIDLKFQNNKDYAICINAEVSGNSMNIRILGKKEIEDYIVKLKPVILEEYEPESDEIIIDDSVPDNEQVVVRAAKKGLKVILYRETYDKKGDLLNKEIISNDVYKPVRGQIKVNSNYFFMEQFEVPDYIE